MRDFYVVLTRSDAEGKVILRMPESISSVLDELEYTEIGESITLTICEMTKEEYDKLPEHLGW